MEFLLSKSVINMMILFFNTIINMILELGIYGQFLVFRYWLMMTLSHTLYKIFTIDDDDECS